MNAVPFDEELTAHHLLVGDSLTCPRGVPMFTPVDRNRPELGSTFRVYRCALSPRHEGRCEPDMRPQRRTTVCGREVTGSWIDWPHADTRPCPACHGAVDAPVFMDALL